MKTKLIKPAFSVIAKIFEKMGPSYEPDKGSIYENFTSGVLDSATDGKVFFGCFTFMCSNKEEFEERSREYNLYIKSHAKPGTIVLNQLTNIES